MNYQEKEMELFDYLKILANSRRILGLSFLVVTLIGVCFAVILPKYNIITSIIGFAGAPIQPSSVVEKIKEGIYNDRVLKTLGREPFPDGLEVKAVLLKQSPVMKISVKVPRHELAFGTVCLQELFKVIDEENKAAIGIYKKSQAENNKEKKIELRLAVFDRELKDRQKQLNYMEEKLKLLDEQKMDLEKRLKAAGEKRDKEEKGNSAVLLKDQVNAINENRDDIALSIINTNKDISRIMTNIRFKTIELKYKNRDNHIKAGEIVNADELKIIKGPETKPVKSKALLIVLIFAALGLGIGVFLALMMEYISQEERKRNNENNKQVN